MTELLRLDETIHPCLVQTDCTSASTMIIRSVSRCVSRPRLVTYSRRVHSRQFQCRRQFGGSSASSVSNISSASTGMSSAGALAPFTNELDRIAPCFRISGSQVRIIRRPVDFYDLLKARRRLVGAVPWRLRLTRPRPRS